jgi:hypothetical protein
MPYVDDPVSKWWVALIIAVFAVIFVWATFFGDAFDDLLAGPEPGAGPSPTPIVRASPIASAPPAAPTSAETVAATEAATPEPVTARPATAAPGTEAPVSMPPSREPSLPPVATASPAG